MNAIWKSKSMPKLKVFCWLLMAHQLNTRDLMLCKYWHLHTGPNCALCQVAVLETTYHLCDCPFAEQCWHLLDNQQDLSLALIDRFEQSRSFFVGPYFMEIFACLVWNN
jgi:hypothetical protein